MSDPPGLFLHASAVLLPGGAALFLGHSTAGKSTIARTLGAWFPVLADDTVFVARDPARGWVVSDGEFRLGAAGFCSVWDRVVELRPPPADLPLLLGCLRIHKGHIVRLEPMHALETCRHLMDAVMEVDLQRKYRPEASRPAAAPDETATEACTSPERTPARREPVGEPVRLPRLELMALRARAERAPSARELEMRRMWFHLVADIARIHPGWHLWFAKDGYGEALRSAIAALGAGTGPVEPS